MVSQALCCDAVSFTVARRLSSFYGIAAERVGYYLVPFAIGNFLGPLLIGRLFDEWGRRPMIASTYAASAGLLTVTGHLFTRGLRTATTQTLLRAAIFFTASAAASSAYLTL